MGYLIDPPVATGPRETMWAACRTIFATRHGLRAGYTAAHRGALFSHPRAPRRRARSIG